MHQKQPVRIGFLTPYSSIYPTMTPSIVNGFYCSMPEQYQNMFQFYPEYIRQGGGNSVKDAVQKLIQFDNVDIISGVISYQKAPEIIPLIEKRKKIGFLFDMGEYLPFIQHLSDYLFFNSFQLWQSEYSLGCWAQKEFGDKGAIIMPLYDAGYHLHSAFRQGTISSGSELIDYHILPYVEAKSQVKGQLGVFFEKFRKEPPSFIHALFCGTEAIDFLVEFKQSGLSETIPLIISAHMASDELLEQLGNLHIKAFSASMWDFNSQNDLNIRFKQQYTMQTESKANLFALLGYEMGLLFHQLIPDFLKRDWDSIIRNIRNETIKSPRGDRNFFLDSNYSTPIIDIEKIEIDNNRVRKIVIGQGRSLKYNHGVFNEIHNECITGWQNPYLCV